MRDTRRVLVELTMTEQRYRAVLEVQAGVPVTEVAEGLGVSRHRSRSRDAADPERRGGDKPQPTVSALSGRARCVPDR